MRKHLKSAVMALSVFGFACGDVTPEEAVPTSPEQPAGVRSEAGATRAAAVAGVRSFLGAPAQEVSWVRSTPLAWNRAETVDVYRAGRFQFEVNAQTQEVVQFGPRPLARADEETMDPEALTGPRLEVAALEERAREYIASHTKVDLSELHARHSAKDELAYFFRWSRDPALSGSQERFIQVGLAADGRIVSYANLLGVPEEGPVKAMVSNIYASNGGYYTAYGPSQYWWTAYSEGYCGHITSACSPSSMQWTYENSTRSNYVIWNVIDVSYAPTVQAFIPRVNATAVSAHYTFQRFPDSPARDSYINQAWYSDVWVNITPGDLTSLTTVMLEDRPGGTVNLSRKVGFDEIQVFY
jgi:hypothetical protein